MTGDRNNCYIRANDIITSAAGYYPCGTPNSTDPVTCCTAIDMCSFDGFCYSSVVLPDGSGFHLGGCNDPTFKDLSCPTQCGAYPYQDVAYNSDTHEWACCYSNPGAVRNCSSPLNKVTFRGPVPDVLLSQQYTIKPLGELPSKTLAIATKATSIISSSISSTQTIPTTTASPTAITVPSGGFSRSVVIEIVVGASIGSVLIAILLIFVLIRYRISKKNSSSTQLKPLFYPTPNCSTPRIRYLGTFEMLDDDEAFHRTRQLDSKNLVPSYELPVKVDHDRTT